MKQPPKPIIKPKDTKVVSDIIFESKKHIYYLCPSRDKPDYLIRESKKSNEWIYYKKMHLDESKKSRLTDQYDIKKPIEPSHTHFGTVYRISQDSTAIYIKVVKGTLIPLILGKVFNVFNTEYVMFFKRLEK